MSGQPTVNIVDDDEMSSQGQCANGGTQYSSTGTSTNTITIRDAIWVASLATFSHRPRDITACPHRAVECFRKTQWSCTHCCYGGGQCATQCCCPHSHRGCAVSPRDQGSLSRSLISFSGYVCKTWTNLGKLTGIGEHGRGVKIGLARGSGVISTSARDTT